MVDSSEALDTSGGSELLSKQQKFAYERMCGQATVRTSDQFKMQSGLNKQNEVSQNSLILADLTYEDLSSGLLNHMP